MASYSAQTLINLALTDIGILEQGGTPSNSDSNAVLALLNNMVQSWQLQDKFIWSNACALMTICESGVVKIDSVTPEIR